MTSRNKRYEDAKREQGLTKLTLWIPIGSEPEFSQMAEYCRDHRTYLPCMARSFKTGKLGKAV